MNISRELYDDLISMIRGYMDTCGCNTFLDPECERCKLARALLVRANKEWEPE